MDSWSEKIARITMEDWLKKHPGSTEEDYHRQRGEEARSRSIQEEQQAHMRAVDAGLTVVVVFHRIFLYVILPLLGAWAIGLMAPNMQFWPTTVGLAILIFILRSIQG